jgi:uncharacterized damage-inducible protein DinB
MSDDAAKAALTRYLQSARDAVVWKLEGASEYDQRRPLVPTGTNLLGLVKHLAGVEAYYLGNSFGRPFPEDLLWAADGAEPNEDMWATTDESPDEIVALYRRVWAHGAATIDELDLDAVGLVPWWSEERRHPTLHAMLVHVIAEVSRHAGHADIIRELIDGETGFRRDNPNLPEQDAAWWDAYHARLEQVARDSIR